MTINENNIDMGKPEINSVFITGGAGFIGSQLSLHLLQAGCKVVAYDNLMLGKKEYLNKCLEFDDFEFVEADLLNDQNLSDRLADYDLVFHLAANSDISLGREKTDLDFKYGAQATYNLLEAMRVSGTKKIVFASTSAIYGDASKKPTPESYGPLIPISLYGASKLAAETLCMAFAHNYGMQTWIYRFANIVGPHLTHGVIYDFIRKLKADSSKLEVLGNGSQEKSYLHVSDCIAGMIYGFENTNDEVNVFNLASEGTTSVRKIAESVVAKTFPSADIQYGDGDRGWVGDVPFTWLDNTLMSEVGWKAKLNSDQAIGQAIEDFLKEIES